MEGIVVAITSAAIRVDGVVVTIRKGDAWAASAPVVQQHPGMFSADQSAARGGTAPVEQATRAPGERSNARRTR